MGQLGMGRAFVVVPTGEIRVRMLTDLQGLIWAGYKPPANVKKAVSTISARIKKDSRRYVFAYDGPTSVYDF